MKIFYYIAGLSKIEGICTEIYHIKTFNFIYIFISVYQYNLAYNKAYQTFLKLISDKLILNNKNPMWKKSTKQSFNIIHVLFTVLYKKSLFPLDRLETRHAQ